MTVMPVVFDPSLYLVVGTKDTGGRALVDLVIAAVSGGVTMVQLREKSTSTETVIELGRALKERLAPYKVPLIVNDSVEITLAVGAEGVHLGQDHLPTPETRARLGPSKIIGASAGTAAEAARLDLPLIDYVGVGPIASTATKPDAGPPIGVTGFADLRAQLPLPVVAIGGIGAENVAALVSAGADGVAVVSTICGAVNPETAARALRRAIDLARQ